MNSNRLVRTIQSSQDVFSDCAEKDINVCKHLMAVASFLYSCIRLICCRPTVEILQLRCVMWSCACYVLIKKQEPIESCADKSKYPQMSLGWYIDTIASNQSRPTGINDSRQVSKSLAGGLSLVATCKAFNAWNCDLLGENVSTFTWVTIVGLRSILQEYVEFIEASKLLSTYTSDFGVIMPLLLELSKKIALDSYFFARLMNFAVCKLKMKSPNSALSSVVYCKSETLSSEEILIDDKINSVTADANQVPDIQDMTEADDQETKYCWCRGDASGKMISCDDCDLWFHVTCMGLGGKVSVVKTINTFLCIACSEKSISMNFVFPYSWEKKSVL